MRTTREEWAKRVQRWQDSRLTAKEFGAENGINPRTLTYWKWRLRKEEGRTSQSVSSKRRRRERKVVEPRFIEVPSSAVNVAEERLELVLGSRHLIRVPNEFDGGALRRLLQVLEGQEQRG